MYKCKIDVTVKLADCPENGLAAVDYRSQNRLPPAPTSAVQLQWEGDSESLCREFPQLCDRNADLIITTDQFGNLKPEFLGKYLDDGETWRATLGQARLTPSEARSFLDGSADAAAVAAVLRSLLAQSDARRDARKRREGEERAEKAAADAAREAEKAARAAAQEKELEGLRAWATEHGSELTRLRLSEGFPGWVSAAHDDYADFTTTAIAADLKPADPPAGYAFHDSEDRLSPTLAELRALRQVKERANPLPVAAELRRCEYRAETDDCGYADPDDEPINRTELVLTVTCPDGHKEERSYLIPE